MTKPFRMQELLTVVDVNFLDQQLMVRNETDHVLHRDFGAVENPTWADFEAFLIDRCFPVARGNEKDILNGVALSHVLPAIACSAGTHIQGLRIDRSAQRQVEDVYMLSDFIGNGLKCVSVGKGLL